MARKTDAGAHPPGLTKKLKLKVKIIFSFDRFKKNVILNLPTEQYVILHVKSSLDIDLLLSTGATYV